MITKPPLDNLAERFCATPLPESVCVDPCASIQGYSGRTGTNLLSVIEAKAVLGVILDDTIRDAEVEIEMANSEREDEQKASARLREDLNEIYALRGEDPLVATICNRNR
jgi:hypothetical protein